MSAAKTTGRSRGGQPGNTNALKHGFYTQRFREMELDDLKDLQVTIEDDIALLRVFLNRFITMTGDFDLQEEPSIDDAVAVLNVVGATTVKIATLIRTQAAISGGNNPEILIAIAEALKAVQAEKGI